jgi:hypothetical protein
MEVHQGQPKAVGIPNFAVGIGLFDPPRGRKPALLVA